ncbi:inactive tyrosine-protein kinase 7-like isoform X2 [Stegodyphus dumicola]|uniref:inactive tyrosine-protein kinase 7-like isoform X2 n=1 Tax=Stegodyphus dumicola TaxID=202533 RepID=UPI0015A75F17|nr:inactive tyrosine-protein kinase 7-like isoform X2 [Stegodyphus dumicola]
MAVNVFIAVKMDIISRQAVRFAVGYIFFLVVAYGQDSYYFQPHPQDQDVRKGQSVTLECGVSNSRHVVFYWTLNGDPVANTSRRYQDGSNLHITRVDPSKDLGEFKCIATNVTTGISLASQGAQLNILWIGEQARVILQSPESVDQLAENGEMVLRCKVEGSSEVRFEWFHNGLRMFRNERVSFRNKRLQVASLSPADNGIYSCRAVSDVGVVDSSDNFALTLPSETAAQIKVLPKDIIATKNGSARFDCVFENAAAVEWYTQTNDVPLVNNSRFTLYPNGSLGISEIRSSDEGIYKCVGISDISKEAPQQTYAARLKLAFIDGFGMSPFEPPVGHDELKVVPLGSQFEVTCVKPGGRPKVRIWWEDSSGRVISDAGRIRVDDSQLIVDGAKKSDTGNYTCVAENIAGQERASLYFYVAAAPTITLPPVSLLAEEGESATFTCEFNGSPYPVTYVKWLKDDQPLKERPGHSVIFLHNGTLIIHKVVMSDSADYVCEVITNGFPPAKSEKATLVVKEQLKFVPPPVSTRLELGSYTKIYCKARGSTQPVVRWMKVGHPFFDWPSHIQDDNGTLFFKGVTNEDAGKYTCIATSSQGIINTTINVDVVVMPKFVIEPEDTQAYEGYSTMLHCQASGDPMPAVQWDKNNVMDNFDQKRFHVMENGTLYVSEVHMEDEGKYGCTVGNSGGFKRAEVNLNVKSAEYYSPNNAGRGFNNDSENTMTKTVTVTLSAAAMYMGLVIGLMVFCRMRRAKKKARLLAEATAEAKSENGTLPNDTEMNALSTKPLKDGSTTKSDGEAQSHSSGSHSHYSKRSRASYDKAHFPRQELQTMMLLGHGEYGEVFLAKAKGIIDAETEMVVMVKALQTRDENAHFEYKREMDMLNKLRHENITKLLGICRETEPFLFITEYSDWGDLKQFLLATRRDNSRKGPRPPPLNVPQILGICHQVATGMEYLSNQRFTHKDLATRNCLVTSRLNIKISFPSLSRDTYAEEYFMYRNRTLPIRWAPAEAILEDEWSTKSDVWSFAVLVWELFTQADLPFSEHSDEIVLKLLNSGELRWKPPSGAPSSLCSLLLTCWSSCARDRPTFTDVVLKIGQVTVDSHL